MAEGWLAVVGVATMIATVAVASGPLVGGFTVPEGGFGAGDDFGTGNASITVLDAPDRATFARGEYDDLRYLTVPDAQLEVRNVTGSPLLSYVVDVDDLGYSRSSVVTLTEASEGSTSIGISRGSFDTSDLTNSTYQATIRILIRSNDVERVIYEDRIPVEVER